ncbi:MAG: SDR family NAD(P)-dependent oxidoreductase [Rhodobacteraceae bacterium]|nr:SDR family NAD(P)-dependent oxidoreductase [Paracoccaceae bacterium]
MPGLDDAVLRCGDAVLPLACNVASYVDVKSAVAAGLDKFGKLDGLVNNAGLSDSAPQCVGACGRRESQRGVIIV